MLKSVLLCSLPLLAAALPQQLSFLSRFTTQSHEDVDLSKYTIGQILNYTLHHAHDSERPHPPLVKLAYVVNRTEEIRDLLSDPKASLSLFAPDDEALQFPEHDHDHDHEHHGPPGHPRGPSHDFEEASDADDSAEMHEAMLARHPLKTFQQDHGDDDKHDEERRRFIKAIVTAVLRYHIVPEVLPVSELQDRQTLPTNLSQVKDADAPFRIRVGTKLELFPPPPSYAVNLNFYAKLRRGPAIIAKNGIIHLISAPLLPPLTPLDQLLLFPNAFATLTSAIQTTELDRHIAPYLHHAHDDKAGLASLLGFEDKPNSAVVSVLEELVQDVKAMLPSKDTYKDFPFTVFSPTNFAFAKIPFKIRLFLFSPFGRPVLKKLLSYHVVPQILFHSDYVLNGTRSSVDLSQLAEPSTSIEASSMWCSASLEPSSIADFPHMPLPPHRRATCPSKDVKVHKYELPTLLGSQRNESLAVNVYEYRQGFGKGPITRKISVGNLEQDEHDHVQVFVSDGVAWGGAIHVVNSLIRPPFAHHHDGDDHHHGPPHHGPPHHGHGHEHDHASYFASLFA